MGTEWSIGCLKCKIQIWLGSQKPFKWRGFQIGDKNVRRFLALHSQCSKPEEGNLLMANDGTKDVPWDDDENQAWKDDILSRFFCFDSLSINYENDTTSLKCADCGSAIAPDADKNYLKKGSFYGFAIRLALINM